MKRNSGSLAALDFAQPQQPLRRPVTWLGWFILFVALIAAAWLTMAWQVQAQGRAQTLRVGGEAQTFDVLTAFLADLDKRPGFAGSQLLGHQQDEQRKVVKFEALLQWRNP